MAKSQTFVVGKTDKDKPLSVDLLRLVDTRVLIQANSGGGKSYLLRLIAERVSGRIQMIILDPEGEFSTLRERVDIALVGEGGELATDLRSAALLARKLIETHVSAIVDLYDLKLPDRRRFVRLFLEALMAVPRQLWHPVLIVLDEAHLFAPEKSAGEAESTAAVIALMSQGRKRGFAGILSTQRLSKLHKDAAAEANNVVIGRTWLDVDQQRAGDLLGMNKADRQALRDLEPGEFYAFGPAFNANGVMRFRSDAVTTTHPRAGERHTLEVPKASAAIQEIVKQLGDLPAQALEEAHTLEALQRDNSDLRRQLRARPVQVQQKLETRVERVDVPVFAAGDVEQLTAAVQTLGSAAAAVTGISADMRRALDMAMRIRETPAPQPAPRPLVPARATTGPAPVATTASAEGLTRPQQAILDALATFEALGIERSHKSNVAVFADQSPSSSGFTNNLGALRTQGLISYPGPGHVELTESGRQQADTNVSIRTLRDLHRAWYAKLSRPKVAILTALIQIYPNAISKDELASQAGQSPTSSGYTNNLGSLRSLGLIDYPQPGHVAATALLFPNLPE